MASPLRPPDLSEDLSVWPNRQSWRNSDEWLVANHRRIRQMRPRVLVLNFANDVEMEEIRRHAESVARASAEATRYHGWEDPRATAFIQYQIVGQVDLRDREGRRAGQRETSSLFPVKVPPLPGTPLCNYAAFYTPEFAPLLGFRHPRRPERFLDLHQLIQSGFVHELWFYAIHDPGDPWPGCETLELKQFYDQECRPIPGRHGHAGNGSDPTMPWSGCSFRIVFLNPHRGPGCALENYGHTLEWMAHSGCIPYFRRYFREFAELDLDRRYHLPFPDLYRTDPARADAISYPSAASMVVRLDDREFAVDPYVAIGGNVHFPPGARHHYDRQSPFTVKSTLEGYRRREGANGEDVARDFNISLISRVGDVAPDCMGNWTVFWRQCMPGLDNPCRDDEGRPMLNWWVFLFY